MATKPDIHYFGIRHHGPGSTQRLLRQLQDLQPKMLLIEGPADCSELIPMLANTQMAPPVSLLAYSNDASHYSIYYPFTEYSPEYQACRWALSNEADVHFIDLPVAVQLAVKQQQELAKETADNDETADDEEDQTSSGNGADDADADKDKPSTPDVLTSDPIGFLAGLAGYEDGESWWNDLIEQNQDGDSEIFDVVAMAMTALREQTTSSDRQSADPERDESREAFMRLEIAKKAKLVEGPIAVVCGAWHVPAFKAKHKATEDRQIVKALPKKLPASKLRSTWIPWTSPRLAKASGYGAGVAAPGWYQHLWDYRDSDTIAESWLTKIAALLRDNGHVVSSASVIEAVRLSHSLAVVRGRPSAGFEEMRDAAIATLCFGEPLLWQEMAHTLLLGNQVGTIPDDAPLMPLQEDLQRQQKALRLKPEALQKELSLDLRSDAGLGKSVLLHRLSILDVPWGKPSDSGQSRGTFRERWLLAWEPEFAVALVENLVYGTTILEAAENRMIEAVSEQSHLNKLAESALYCLEADLPKSAQKALNQLDVKAAQTSDCIELLEALPPLIHVERYGTARDINLSQVSQLVSKISVQSALALPYACRQLNEEEASHYRQVIQSAWQAIQLCDLQDDVLDHWWSAFEQLSDSPQSSSAISGLAARLLYQAEKLSDEEIKTRLQRALSPALPILEAAGYFEGFFSNATQRLLYDNGLLNIIETWLVSLTEADFVEFLPLFRRVFADLDAMERKRLMDVITGSSGLEEEGRVVIDSALSDWQGHMARLTKLMARQSPWSPS